MPHTLLLRLPEPGQNETEWLSIDQTGMATTAKQRGPLSLAAAVGRSAHVIVLAPATQILLAEPELPPGSGVKLARVVPFALEEQLTEDIDQLYFAVGRRGPTGRTPVAVVSRSLLQGWTAQLTAAGIEPAAIYADISLVPDNPGQTMLWLEKARLAVRRPGMLPFAVELTPVSEALVVAGVIPDPLEAAAPKVPESAILHLTREDWLKVQDEFEGLAEQFASLKVQLLRDGPLPWLARNLAATDAVNLLQGEFARATDYGARWRQWRTAALLAAGLLASHLSAEALQIHRANRETKALDGEIAQIFAKIMPAEKMDDPRRQMQARLDRIRRSGPGPEYFLRTLQGLSTALASSPKTSIDSLSYREQSLDMKVTATSLAALSQLTQLMGKQGMAAEIQSSTPTNSGIEAHLQVRTEGAKAHR
ncbi:MAG: type II secretion system protein GspL [Steroidobacteraceae bacterium]